MEVDEVPAGPIGVVAELGEQELARSSGSRIGTFDAFVDLLRLNAFT